MEEDPDGQNDLAQSRTDKLREMLVLWEQYVADNDVLVFDGLEMGFTNGKDYYKPVIPADAGIQ